jgi:hypothetical protein
VTAPWRQIEVKTTQRDDIPVELKTGTLPSGPLCAPYGRPRRQVECSATDAIDTFGSIAARITFSLNSSL